MQRGPAYSWRLVIFVHGLCWLVSRSTIHFETGWMTCCTEHRLSLKRYVTMTVTWTIIIAWLAIQVPLGVLIGKTIKFGTIGHAKKNAPSGVVWC